MTYWGPVIGRRYIALKEENDSTAIRALRFIVRGVQSVFSSIFKFSPAKSFSTLLTNIFSSKKNPDKSIKVPFIHNQPAPSKSSTSAKKANSAQIEMTSLNKRDSHLFAPQQEKTLEHSQSHQKKLGHKSES